MFLGDNPVKTGKDDLLERKDFAKHLGKAISEWKESESLVIALNGEWGIGKSSIINMALDHIENDIEVEKPTIISYNPWIYSDLSNLTSNFFDELSKELAIQNQAIKDKEIADKLKLYSNLLNMVPDKTVFKATYDKLIIGIGLAGISLSSIAEWIGVTNEVLKNILFISGAVLILGQLTRGALTRLSNFFGTRSKIREKTAIDYKAEITNELLERNKKLVIIIDDIDRLTYEETKEIFRLIKINADFPNTIYLLSFEKEVVQKNLDVSLGVSGAKYMEKIVQVSFDVPEAQAENIHKYLFEQLDRILSRLPESVLKYFSTDSIYWGNVFQSGIKYFFKNLRHVKRFASSLEFNISQMYKDSVMEVNPIDFIAIETLKVFRPDFHNFMRQNKELFTATRNPTDPQNNDQRQKKIKNAISNLTGEYEQCVTELLKQLFPQIGNVIDKGYSSYGSEWISNWSRDLRVCSPTHFDSYFVYLPKGSSKEISQFELETTLQKINNKYDFESKLNEFVQNKKIRKLLQIFQDYTSDNNKFPNMYFQNIIIPLLNITDSLPSEPEGMTDFGADVDVMRIIYQLLKRENNQEDNFNLLHEAILHSTSLYGVVKKISIISPLKDDTESSISLVKDEHLLRLQQLCIDKIKKRAQNHSLLESNNLLYILYRWKEWGSNEDFKSFIEELISDEKSMLTFLKSFRSTSFISSVGDYVSRKNVSFNYKSLKDFVPDIDAIKLRLIEIKTNNQILYKEYKEFIDLFLENYDKRDEYDF
ncbi:putative KAP-like P-loop ATPase [Sinobaca qinghaiensis]|uniref:Putative KAP-like P-loop ATPase n=1 Tax=Sinobaca qinghaiensis TaxID=342944 RepID=A0A419UZS7_9BACL|nr:P-loop NTPase fold protein [Sinobaca qinghaiensis]RKD71195.1 putative KAP-like P-loop ATPase [Sinobaca qinghaiensis]